MIVYILRFALKTEMLISAPSFYSRVFFFEVFCRMLRVRFAFPHRGNPWSNSDLGFLIYKLILISNAERRGCEIGCGRQASPCNDRALAVRITLEGDHKVHQRAVLCVRTVLLTCRFVKASKIVTTCCIESATRRLTTMVTGRRSDRAAMWRYEATSVGDIVKRMPCQCTAQLRIRILF